MTGDKYVFEGKLASMLTPFELFVGDQDLIETLDRVNEKRVKLTIEVLE